MSFAVVGLVDRTGAQESDAEPTHESDDETATTQIERRWSFQRTRKTSPGWAIADGEPYNQETGSGWASLDGRRRQCGKRNKMAELRLDTFCHASATYDFVGGRWETTLSPASWHADVPNGVYDLTVVVGESGRGYSSIRHSVQVEGVSVVDSAVTTNRLPLHHATAVVEVEDGSLDVTFTGGVRTKIVSIQLVGVPVKDEEPPATVPDDPTLPGEPRLPDVIPVPDPPVGIEDEHLVRWQTGPFHLGLGLGVDPDWPTITANSTEDTISAPDSLNTENLSLRDALSLAAAIDGPTIIELLPRAIYVLGCGTDEDANVDGDLDYRSTDLLVIVGNGATVIGPQAPCAQERIFDSVKGGPLGFVDLRVTAGGTTSNGGAIRGAEIELVNCLLDGNAALTGSGGAVDASLSLTVSHSTLVRNRAATGGAAAAVRLLRITDSVVSGNVALYDGGAVLGGAGGDVTITRSVLSANRSAFGRGAAVFSAPHATTTIVGSQFQDNLADESSIGGGAVYADGQLVVRESTFVRNAARSATVHDFLSTGGGGGAIYVEGSASISSSDFIENESGLAGAGGALHAKGNLSIENSIFSANLAGGAGGGIYVSGGHVDGSSIVISGSTITDNVSNGTGGGGAYLASRGSITVSTSTISSNRAAATGGSGGGVFISGSGSISESVVAENSTTFRGSGGGIHVDLAGRLDVTDTFVIDNRAGLGGGIDADDGPSAAVTVLRSTISGNSSPLVANLSIRSRLVIGDTEIGVAIGGPDCDLSRVPVSLGGVIGADDSCSIE